MKAFLSKTDFEALTEVEKLAYKPDATEANRYVVDLEDGFEIVASGTGRKLDEFRENNRTRADDRRRAADLDDAHRAGRDRGVPGVARSRGRAGTARATAPGATCSTRFGVSTPRRGGSCSRCAPGERSARHS